MRVAALQMTSGADVAANLRAAAQLLGEAREGGASVAVLPENFAFMGRGERAKLAVAETPGDGPVQRELRRLARELDLWIVAGTLALKTDRDDQVAAASLVFDAAGECVARYDKIHLFDVDVPDSAESHRESASVRAGSKVVVVDTPAGRLGLSVCYDVRFPELYRQMSLQGAQWYAVPSAFTVPTGRAHWELLLRARAVENLSAVVAAAQWGSHENGRETWGDSLIVDHWGAVLERRRSGVGVVVAELNMAEQGAVRQRFPALSHRKLARDSND